MDVSAPQLVSLARYMVWTKRSICVTPLLRFWITVGLARGPTDEGGSEPEGSERGAVAVATPPLLECKVSPNAAGPYPEADQGDSNSN